MHEALILSRLIHFGSLFALFGGSAFRVYALGGEPVAHESGAISAFDRWSGRYARLGAVLVLLSAAAMLVATTGMMAGSISASVQPATIATVLSQTEFGQVWCVRLVLAVLLVFACFMPQTGRRRATVLVLSGLLLVSLGLVGHAAMDQGGLRVVHELNQMAHLLAGAFWLGGLLPLAWFLVRLRRNRKPGWYALSRALLPRFSQMGYTAVAVLALTGTINTALLVGSPGALAGTPYGRLLLLKLLLFVAMLTLAAVNRFRLMRQIALQSVPDAPLSALARSVWAEQALAFAIVVVVSVLGTLSPAIHAVHG
jgi:putative copper resistance protein D